MRSSFLLCLALLFGAILSPVISEDSTAIPESARTQANALNDLVRELPLTAGSWMDQLRRRSAIQEQLHLHELKTRGEGLPTEMAQKFSENYCAILTALVEDRLEEQSGRELLAEHRRLLSLARQWIARSERLRNPSFPDWLSENLLRLQADREQRSLPLDQVPDDMRTPVVNGYQAWVGELIAWGEASGRLTGGDLSRLRTKLAELERFESLYKADGRLLPNEREKLHGRLISQAVDIVTVVSR